MIKHDRSAVSIVTTCTDCPWWYAFNFDRKNAEASAIRHKINVHGMTESRAQNAARERERRARKHERHAANA